MSHEEQDQNDETEKLKTGENDHEQGSSEKNIEASFPLLEKSGSSKAWKAFYAAVSDEIDA